ncbi:MAG TPA: hypothetical protein VES95_01585 [Dermatophilaceae bacterium]|nr:hypothetical protein [Dermatophilaceae bacterium]
MSPPTDRTPSPRRARDAAAARSGPAVPPEAAGAARHRLATGPVA